MPDGEREGLRATVNSAAGRYHRARPHYPDALHEELIGAVRLRPGTGCWRSAAAPGGHPLPLARRGFRVTCVKLGRDLTTAVRRHLAGLGADVIECWF